VRTSVSAGATDIIVSRKAGESRGVARPKIGRPRIAIMLAILSFFRGASTALVGTMVFAVGIVMLGMPPEIFAQMRLFGVEPLTAWNLILIGLLLVVSGSLGFVASWLLWRGRGYALLIAVASLGATLGAVHGVLTKDSIGAALGVVVNAAILYYLTTSSARLFFHGRPTRGSEKVSALTQRP